MIGKTIIICLGTYNTFGHNNMDNYLILIVEDELVTKTMLRNIFEAEGYDVIEASNGDEMYDALSNNKIDLIIMDINLPGKNGLLLARELKEKYKQTNASIGLVFLTGRDNDIDKILGLEIGADDYITKPFNPRELAIRTRNLLHRTASMRKSSDEEEIEKVSFYKFEGWTLDVNSHSLIAPDSFSYRLPKSEFRAMQFFCDFPRKIHSREVLLEKMTGRQFKPNDRSVDVTIRRLRQYFNEHTPTLEIITTIHGEGYRFSTNVEKVQ